MFQRNDWIVGVFSILLGTAVIFGTTFWHELTSLDPAGPGGVPKLLAWVIIAIGVIHLIGVFMFTSKGAKADWAKEYEEYRPILQITLVSAIYIIILKYIGYLIATPLLIAGILWIVKVRSAKNILVTSIGTTLIFFLVFYVGLKVRLPMGFLADFF